MKVGILTLPLHTNFGGILQAYALQTLLQDMGHQAFVIDKKRTPRKRHPLVAPFVWTTRFIRRYIKGDKECVVFLEQKINKEYPTISQHTQKFIDSHINKLPCSKLLRLNAGDIDAIVVGSDQVWRPREFEFGYGKIDDAYLAFAKEWSIKRLSYAASFGTDKWEYTKHQTARCRKLIAKFDFVSVREASAVGLCRQKFNIEATHLLDPTMLLSKEEYTKLANQIPTPKSAGNLLVYILDQTPDKQAVVSTIAKNRGLTPFDTKATDNINAPIEERIQPPIEQWLKAFIDAEFIVTDSFHASVFAIIFNKPFIAYSNNHRGAARLQSLLSMFGLENQFITSSQELSIEHLKEIEWYRVNQRLDKLKAASLTSIADAIGN